MAYPLLIIEPRGQRRGRTPEEAQLAYAQMVRFGEDLNARGLLKGSVCAAGGATYNEPQDHGFMYGHGFQDPDGHIWEVIYMEPA